MILKKNIQIIAALFFSAFFFFAFQKNIEMLGHFVEAHEDFPKEEKISGNGMLL